MRLPQQARKGLTLCALLSGCAGGSTQQGGSDYGFVDATSRRVWARGPWERVQPSHDIDDVIDQLCPAIMTLPAATLGDYGLEYCGVIYSLGQGVYYASNPSPLAARVQVGTSRRKSCRPPMEVRDPRGRASIFADFHSHPWFPSSLSEEDRKSDTQWYSIRIQFDTHCIIHKLVPHADDDLPGEIYVREGRRWRRVGSILPEDKATGRITAVEEP